MQLLARALEQGLIGRLLDERMLKHIPRLGRQPALIHQFGLDQLFEALL